MNLESVQKAIVESKYGPVAKEEGARLTQTFIDNLDNYPDSTWETIAVELAWFLRLDEKAIVVGVMDRICRSPEGQVWGSEWKSKGEPKRKKDGTYYAGATEQDWLEEISSGPQLRIYALALKHATFVDFKENRQFELNVADPRILVRAVIKANPAFCWPTDPLSGQFTFPEEYLAATQFGLWSAVEQVRAARKRAVLPWILPGGHCENKYRRMCEHFLPYCHAGKHPVAEVPTSANNTDPGWAAIEASGVDLNDPETVVVSASSYADLCWCIEKYRISIAGLGQREESMALDTGSVMHLGIAESFRQLERERG